MIRVYRYNVSEATIAYQMYRYYCQEHPFIYSLTAQILARDAGRIMVEHSPFFPGGGGQLADRGTIISNGKSTTVKAVEILPEGVWHTIEKSIGDCDFVEIRVDEYHRTCLLYTSPSPRDGLLTRMPSSA